MTNLTGKQYISLQQKWSYWNEQWNSIIGKEVSGKRRRKIIFNVAVYDRCCDLVEGHYAVDKPARRPEKADLEDYTIENVKKWQRMVEKHADIVLNSL